MTPLSAHHPYDRSRSSITANASRSRPPPIPFNFTAPDLAAGPSNRHSHARSARARSARASSCLSLQIPPLSPLTMLFEGILADSALHDDQPFPYSPVSSTDDEEDRAPECSSTSSLDSFLSFLSTPELDGEMEGDDGVLQRRTEAMLDGGAEEGMCADVTVRRPERKRPVERGVDIRSSKRFSRSSTLTPPTIASSKVEQNAPPRPPRPPHCRNTLEDFGSQPSLRSVRKSPCAYLQSFSRQPHSSHNEQRHPPQPTDRSVSPPSRSTVPLHIAAPLPSTYHAARPLHVPTPTEVHPLRPQRKPSLLRKVSVSVRSEARDATDYSQVKRFGVDPVEVLDGLDARVAVYPAPGASRMRSFSSASNPNRPFTTTSPPYTSYTSTRNRSASTTTLAPTDAGTPTQPSLKRKPSIGSSTGSTRSANPPTLKLSRQPSRTTIVSSARNVVHESLSAGKKVSFAT